MKKFSMGFLVLSLLSAPVFAQEAVQESAQESKELELLKDPKTWSRVVVVTKRGKDEFNSATGVFTKNKSYIETSRKTVRKVEFVNNEGWNRSRSILLTLSDGSKLGVHFGAMVESYGGHDWKKDPEYASKFKQYVASALQPKKGQQNELELMIKLNADQKMSNIVRREYFYDGKTAVEQIEFPKNMAVLRFQDVNFAAKNIKSGLRHELDLSELLEKGIEADQAMQRAVEELEYKEELEKERKEEAKRLQAERDAEAARESESRSESTPELVPDAGSADAGSEIVQ